MPPRAPGIPSDDAEAKEDNEEPYAKDNSEHDQLGAEGGQVAVEERTKDTAVVAVAAHGGVRDGLGDVTEQRGAEEEHVVWDGWEGNAEVRLEEGDAGLEGVDLTAKDTVEELVRSRTEEGGWGRAVRAKRGVDARLDLGVVRDDGGVEPAGGGVDPGEELGIEGGTDGSEGGVDGGGVPLRLARERGVDRGADRVGHVCGEGVCLACEAFLDGAEGDKLDADEEDAGDADDEAGECGWVEDEREEPGEAVACWSCWAELEDAREQVDDPPCEGVLHLHVERHERGVSDLHAWLGSGSFLASAARHRGRIILPPAGTNDVGGLGEPPPL